MKSIVSRIDEWGLKEPNRQAYDYLGQTYTYGQLKTYSDALAKYLQNMNLAAKAPIVVFGGQSFEMLVAFLGCVKAGHAYIPIDDSSPKERVQLIVEIAKPAACITISELDLTLDSLIITNEELTSLMTSNDCQYETTLSVKQEEDFYIIFTSGTTGVPKGVRISHDNLVSFCNWMLQDFALPTGVTCLAQPPYSFDLSVMNLYPTLLLGGKLVAMPKEISMDFKQLFAKLPTLKIKEWVSTPSFVELCMLDPNFNAQNLPDLTYLLFCGEELTHATADKLKQRFPQAQIYNTYGPTEATVAVTVVRLDEQIMQSYTRLPIGKAKEDTRVILLDENEQEVGLNQAGEITIIGPSVSAGYLNNPEKTAASFKQIADQWAYKTGDLGQYDENGQLLYKGRLDFQIKLHGYRIELEDVDHHLAAVSVINQAIAIPKYDKDHKVSQLLAYVVVKETQNKDVNQLTKEIKDELNQTMMAYMMPQRFIYVDSLPLTQNGKIDRKKLMAEVNGSC